ncbi:MAG: bifunctional phosphopantothenoylcysteine decarboxylase/phosphopantothenate synthase, partial [Phycisphaerae bacterium]|nr:bifunctional phosphopantothenoylcysteine decarboxylase/phosphopantothenate synthase [Phycisphaerae bacterium]
VCCDKKVLLAPAMNCQMWANPIVQKNMAILTEQLKFKTVGPETGRLACGTEGVGRMAEPAAIIEAIAGL